MSYSFEVSGTVPATPTEVYDAWLDGRAHAEMTGSAANASPVMGATFSAWDGYITGRNVALERPGRIVQSWRTSEFKSSDGDSHIEVVLAAVKGGTRITIRHSGVPDGQTGYERGGWEQSYFKPMKAYFSARRRARA